MASYEITQGADADLAGIARYTIDTWGIDQALKYGNALERHFEAIGKKPGTGKAFLLHRPELRVTRCEHHYVFHLIRPKQPPLILAVLHERMDLMTRLRHRIEG